MFPSVTGGHLGEGLTLPRSDSGGITGEMADRLLLLGVADCGDFAVYLLTDVGVGVSVMGEKAELGDFLLTLETDGDILACTSMGGIAW